MRDRTLIGPWIRRFLLEHLVSDRNLTRNTQASYRDTLLLLLPFVSQAQKKPTDRLMIDDLLPSGLRSFLEYLEKERGCSGATRNLRLAAIHSLAKFIGMRSPEHVAWSTEIRAVPFKKMPKSSLTYLDKPEIDALLKAPDLRTPQGSRDYALLPFLYNTGARVDMLKPLVAGRNTQEFVFLNRRDEPLTRFGIYSLVRRAAYQASRTLPSIAAKRISPHCLRHSCAVHLLRSGVDINTIRAWLGHVSLDTTHIYAEVDLEMKAKALALCDLPNDVATTPWHSDPGLIGFLRSL